MPGRAAVGILFYSKQMSLCHLSDTHYVERNYDSFLSSSIKIRNPPALSLPHSPQPPRDRTHKPQLCPGMCCRRSLGFTQHCSGADILSYMMWRILYMITARWKTEYIRSAAESQIDIGDLDHGRVISVIYVMSYYYSLMWFGYNRLFSSRPLNAKWNDPE